MGRASVLRIALGLSCCMGFFNCPSGHISTGSYYAEISGMIITFEVSTAANADAVGRSRTVVMVFTFPWRPERGLLPSWRRARKSKSVALAVKG